MADVRDVAVAFVRAMKSPLSAGQKNDSEYSDYEKNEKMKKLSFFDFCFFFLLASSDILLVL